MRHLAPTFGVFLTLALLTPGVAVARGGHYRGPNGAVPPGLREPSDPTPPPPPPPPPPGSPAPGVGPTIPTAPTAPPPPDVPLVPRTTGSGAPMTFANWRFWYLNEHEALEPRGPRWTDRAALEPALLPALRAALAADEGKTLRGAACLALGRATSQPADVEVLRALARGDEDVLVRESAVLALGLLRRTDAALQFDAALLDAVRADLVALVKDDDANPSRTRAFGAIALALLTDQPSRSEATVRVHAATLLAVLQAKTSRFDLQAGLLRAIAMFPPAALTADQRGLLHEAATSGRLGDRDVPSPLVAHLVLALGRLGGEEDAGLLVVILDQRRPKDVNIKRSAVIGLMHAAPPVSAQMRTRIVDALTQGVQAELERRAHPRTSGTPRPMDETQAHLALIALARVAALDLAAGAHLTERVTTTGALLRERLGSTWPGESAYGALGLALLGRAVGGTDEPAAARWLEDTRRALEAELARKQRTPDDRGAFAAALGVLGHRASVAPLRALVADTRQDPALRAAAARALGMLADGDDASIRALRAAFEERRSESLRIGGALGLGLAQDAASAGALVDGLRQARSWHAKGAAALALGALGPGAHAQVPGLVALLAEAKTDESTRAVAAAALGLIGDPEPISSLARATVGGNWRASTDCLDELLSLL